MVDVYKKFKSEAKIRKDSIIEAATPSHAEAKKKGANTCYREFAQLYLHQLVLETLGLAEEEEQLIYFKHDWKFYGPETVFCSDWSSGWYLNQLLSKEVEHNQPSILLFDSQDDCTDIYTLSLNTSVGQVGIHPL
jgi:hypothetical protein